LTRFRRRECVNPPVHEVSSADIDVCSVENEPRRMH
jgi:hypothetical protein